MFRFLTSLWRPTRRPPGPPATPPRPGSGSNSWKTAAPRAAASWTDDPAPISVNPTQIGQPAVVAPGGTVTLNPQPLPPGGTVGLNPQPLPPMEW